MTVKRLSCSRSFASMTVKRLSCSRSFASMTVKRLSCSRFFASSSANFPAISSNFCTSPSRSKMILDSDLISLASSFELSAISRANCVRSCDNVTDFVLSGSTPSSLIARLIKGTALCNSFILSLSAFKYKVTLFLLSISRSARASLPAIVRLSIPSSI